MSETRVAVLTPAGTGAIATVAVAGPRAWDIARQHFAPASSRPLPETPELRRFWFGRLAHGDEVVLAVEAVEPEPTVEVHCHGGRRVVRWVVELFLASGCVESEPPAVRPGVRSHLPRTPTLRTASILLDQFHGAFDRAIASTLADLDAGRASPQLAELARLAPVGRHLVEPWKVVVAGPPNVGKSSLVNALAGYQRSVVSEVAGTTRDVVTVPVAFDGWPVELADTAGLRAAAGLEAAGIERAERFIRDADLVVWVLDATADDLEYPGDDTAPGRLMFVLNKVDVGPTERADLIPDVLPVSAATGKGVPGLAATVARRLVPHAPQPGTAVPYTPALAEGVYLAHVSAAFGEFAEAAAILRAAAGPG